MAPADSAEDGNDAKDLSETEDEPEVADNDENEETNGKAISRVIISSDR